MNRKTCSIQYNKAASQLISLSVEEGGFSDELIDKTNAEDIVKKYKNDPYIVAKIDNNTLNVSVRYPIVVVDCKYPGEKSTPSVYVLNKTTIKENKK